MKRIEKDERDRRFDQLLARVHQHTRLFSPEEIEADIALTSQEVRDRRRYADRTQEEASSAFDRLAIVALAELWDNEEDAVYDNWKEIYHVQQG